ncbi:MAG: Cro/CI family transcriptional regulator [Candidatus Competibacter sp.]|nr:Cro/CI family transcriptional regulator [Candidatus Competibacter sp.]
MEMNFNPMQAAIEAVERDDGRFPGRRSDLARRLGVSHTAVSKWVKEGRPPVGRVLEIERATEGRVNRHVLRPDIFGPS